MNISITLTEIELKKIVFEHLCERMGKLSLCPEDVKIEVKSKQNYKAEWESAAFRATINKSTP